MTSKHLIDFAAAQVIGKSEAFQKSMKAKAVEFVKGGAEIHRKVVAPVFRLLPKPIPSGIFNLDEPRQVFLSGPPRRETGRQIRFARGRRFFLGADFLHVGDGRRRQ